MPCEHPTKGTRGLSFDASIFVPGASFHSINTLSKYTSTNPEAPIICSNERLEDASIHPPFDSFDLADRLDTFIKGADGYSSVVGSFLPLILRDFVKPVWSSLNVQKKSCMNVLPEVCAFPCTPIPRTWVPASFESSYFLCKTFSNKWTLVDSCHLHESSMKVRSIPDELQRFMASINSFPSRGSSSIVFDSALGHAYLVEVDWCNDQVFVYQYSHQGGLVPLATIDELSPGAVHIHGISGGNLILSAGADIFILSLTGTVARRQIRGGPLNYGDTERLPVSTQTVVPMVSIAGRVMYLAGGSLYSSSCELGVSENRILHLSNRNIKYVSLSYDSEKDVVALVGFDYRANISRQYITLFDPKGLFVLSTQEVPDCPPLSIVSTAIDPISNCTIVVGRCNGRSRQGAVCQAFPPLYN